MKKRTTTHQINATITNKLLQVVKVEVQNKSTYQMSTMDNDTFIEALEFLAESDVFADCVGWKYEKCHGPNGEYIFETGRLNPESDYIVSVYMRMRSGVSKEELDDMLVKEEEE